MRLKITENQYLSLLNERKAIDLSKEELLKYLEQGLSVPQIVKELEKDKGIKTNVVTIHYKCDKYKISCYTRKKIDLTKEDLVKYLEQGLTVYQIAEKLKISINSVYQKCDKYKISCSTRKKIDLSKEELLKYLEQGLSVPQIVKELEKDKGIKTSITTIRTKCNEYGLHDMCTKLKKVNLSKEELLKYLEQGLSVPQIVKELEKDKGIKTNVVTIRDKCSEYGLYNMCTKLKRVNLSKEDLVKYLKQGLTVYQIAEKLKISTYSVYQRCSIYGINPTDYYNNKSSGEILVKSILDNFVISGLIKDLEDDKVKLYGCYGFKCTKNLTVDFKFKYRNKIIYIEVDGAFHFKKEDDYMFESIVCNDRLTNKVITNKGHSIIRIPAVGKMETEKIKNFLENAIKRINPSEIILTDDYPKEGWRDPNLNFCLLDKKDLKRVVYSKFKKIKTVKELDDYKNTMMDRLEGEELLLKTFLDYVNKKREDILLKNKETSIFENYLKTKIFKYL